MGTPVVVGDRVLVATATTGTGAYQLGSAITGYLDASAVASGARVAYVVVDSLTTPTQFEVGEGVYTSGSPSSITRATVIRNSAGGTSAVNWGVGTKYLALAPSAQRLALFDTDGQLPLAADPAEAEHAARKAYVDALLPSGTKMLFVQTSAPVGWTKQTTHNDKALRVVSGTASAGGTLAFSTAFASRGLSGTVQGHTLTTSEMPWHQHGYLDRINTGGGEANVNGTNSGGSDLSRTTDGAGGGGSHAHGLTINNLDMAVSYVDVIIATKD